MNEEASFLLDEARHQYSCQSEEEKGGEKFNSGYPFLKKEG
jgi:hypothetical protein